MNSIQIQMDSIARDESKWGSIIDIGYDSRGKGKTFNLEKVAEYFDWTVLRKHTGGDPRLNVEIYSNTKPNHIRGKNKIFVMDEGFTLDEIREFQRYGVIVFSLWSSLYEKDIVKLNI